MSYLNNFLSLDFGSNVICEISGVQDLGLENAFFDGRVLIIGQSRNVEAAFRMGRQQPSQNV